ncbi:MAG TPA: hypothetical protein VNR39_18220 [Pseudolabrys sp.]|nr:hypothetical protein [Pseudolabrys sp.]
MSKKLFDYTAENLLDTASLSPNVVIYNVPNQIAVGGIIKIIPFSLTEDTAGMIFRTIVSDKGLVKSLEQALERAKHVPRATNTTGSHPVDENLLAIERIVRSIEPEAPIDIVFWFTRLAYEMILGRSNHLPERME